MSGLILAIDPERITERVFGGPHFIALERIEGRADLVRHPKIGRVYSLAEVDVAWFESRNARPVIYAGPMAGLPWRRGAA